MESESTFVMFKPDAVKRNISLKIIEIIENAGFVCTKPKYIRIADKETVRKHYEEHEGKSWIEKNIEFICSGTILICIFTGENVVSGVRKLIGKMDEKGTIRGDFIIDREKGIRENLIHGSDSIESAKREIKLWFPGKE